MCFAIFFPDDGRATEIWSQVGAIKIGEPPYPILASNDSKMGFHTSMPCRPESPKKKSPRNLQKNLNLGVFYTLKISFGVFTGVLLGRMPGLTNLLFEGHGFNTTAHEV